MALLVHLSDLHMGKNPGGQQLVFDKLVTTLRRERERARPEHVVLVITGDVFDSATLEPRALVQEFSALHARIVGALGGNAPTIILPGNHDRRRLGLLGPHREALFDALRDAMDPRRVFVAGCQTPFLSQIVPGEMHGLPAHVIAYDSSYLPSGYVGAGGTIRAEDLLHANAQLPDDGKLLVILVHHHLVPTPITDMNHVDSVRAPALGRWLVRSALPALVSYADREELTMTALGAGTALSTLHGFGRAVLLLHGHKHVPTARIVRGMTTGCGDLLVASAGSAGVRERVVATRHPDAARLWPSFNLIDLSDARVRIESVSFSPKRSSRLPLRRDLAAVRRLRHKWDLEPISFEVSDPTPRVDIDEADFTLQYSFISPNRWSFSCERRVRIREGERLRNYVDFVRALPARRPGSSDIRREQRRIELTIGGVTRYSVDGGLCRTLEEARRWYGIGTAFEWVGLFCRYGAARATLRLGRANAGFLYPFGSLTDVATGRERPAGVIQSDLHWTVTWESCAPRSLLRIYWPLSRS